MSNHVNPQLLSLLLPVVVVVLVGGGPLVQEVSFEGPFVCPKDSLKCQAHDLCIPGINIVMMTSVFRFNCDVIHAPS